MAKPTPALRLSSGARPLQKKDKPELLSLSVSSPSSASLVSLRVAMSILYLVSSSAMSAVGL